MNQKDQRWKQRFENFISALKSIEEVIPRFNTLAELEQDGLIQRFEFTFDLSWKLMQDYLSFIGYSDIKGPRPVITQMAKDGYLDPYVWEELLVARNELSHIYDEQKSRNYLSKIVEDYYPAFEGLKNKLAAKL